MSLTLVTFAGLGLLALIATLAPSPARLGDDDSVEIPQPRLLFPELVQQGVFGDFAAIVEHPLFNADRKEDPPEANSGAKSLLPALDGYRLAGVIVTGDTSLAMIERRATNTTATLRVGDNLDGRIVKEITAEGVIFTGSSVPEMLAIPKATGAKFTTENTLNSGVNASGAVSNKLGMGDRDAK